MKSPDDKLVKEKHKSKNTTPSKSFIDKDLKALDAKWSGRFSRFEAMLVAKTLEKPAELTFQRVKVTPTRKPPAGTVYSRGVTSTNNSGRMLADKNSTQHRALAKFSIHLNRKRHPIWRLP